MLAQRGLLTVFPMHLGVRLVADCPVADQVAYPMHLVEALVADQVFPKRSVMMEAGVRGKKEHHPKQWVVALMACYLVALEAEGIHPLWFSSELPWLMMTDADSGALAEGLADQREVELWACLLMIQGHLKAKISLSLWLALELLWLRSRLTFSSSKAVEWSLSCPCLST